MTRTSLHRAHMARTSHGDEPEKENHRAHHPDSLVVMTQSHDRGLMWYIPREMTTNNNLPLCSSIFIFRLCFFMLQYLSLLQVHRQQSRGNDLKSGSWPHVVYTTRNHKPMIILLLCFFIFLFLLYSSICSTILFHQQYTNNGVEGDGGKVDLSDVSVAYVSTNLLSFSIFHFYLQR